MNVIAQLMFKNLLSQHCLSSLIEMSSNIYRVIVYPGLGNVVEIEFDSVVSSCLRFLTSCSCQIHAYDSVCLTLANFIPLIL